MQRRVEVPVVGEGNPSDGAYAAVGGRSQGGHSGTASVLFPLSRHVLPFYLSVCLSLLRALRKSGFAERAAESGLQTAAASP